MTPPSRTPIPLRPLIISIVLLIVLFRSLLIPVIATLGFLLSGGASFGASVAVFGGAGSTRSSPPRRATRC